MKKYAKSTRFGIYNRMTKRWRNDVYAETPMEAQDQLYKAIKTSAYKWRYEVRALPTGKGGIPSIPINPTKV